MTHSVHCLRLYGTGPLSQRGNTPAKQTLAYPEQENMFFNCPKQNTRAANSGMLL